LDDSSPEFHEWISLHGHGLSRDFDRGHTSRSIPGDVKDGAVDLSSFELVRALSNNSHVPIDLLANRAAGCRIAVTNFLKSAQ
jgi:hypothetical protein